jgi:hypothetical protein
LITVFLLQAGRSLFLFRTSFPEKRKISSCVFRAPPCLPCLNPQTVPICLSEDFDTEITGNTIQAIRKSGFRFPDKIAGLRRIKILCSRSGGVFSFFGRSCPEKLKISSRVSRAPPCPPCLKPLSKNLPLDLDLFPKVDQ